MGDFKNILWSLATLSVAEKLISSDKNLSVVNYIKKVLKYQDIYLKLIYLLFICVLNLKNKAYL